MKRKERRIGVVSIALTYAGCMIGAGFVSGQELWQYFGSYGRKGILSLVLSFLLLGAAALVLVLLSRRVGKTAMDDLILKADLPVLKNLIGDGAALIIFSNVSIMIAGIGALAEESAGLSRPIVNLIVTALIGVCSYFGIGGMMAVFDCLVPLLVASTLTLCGVRLGSAGFSGIRLTEEAAVNPLLGSCGLASVNYAAMNYFGVLTVFPPLGQKIEKKRTLLFALLLGTAMLILSGLGIVFALSTSGEAAGQEIPMQDIAREFGAVPGGLIAVMMLSAMFGVGVSYQVSAMSYLEGRSEKGRKYRLPVHLALLIISYVLSLIGFGDLISYLYPVFGYFGMILMLLIVIRYAGTFRKSRMS